MMEGPDICPFESGRCEALKSATIKMKLSEEKVKEIIKRWAMLTKTNDTEDHYKCGIAIMEASKLVGPPKEPDNKGKRPFTCMGLSEAQVLDDLSYGPKEPDTVMAYSPLMAHTPTEDTSEEEKERCPECGDPMRWEGCHWVCSDISGCGLRVYSNTDDIACPHHCEPPKDTSEEKPDITDFMSPYELGEGDPHSVENQLRIARACAKCSTCKQYTCPVPNAVNVKKEEDNNARYKRTEEQL